MTRRYLFSDESGNLDFARHAGATRYFAVGTMLIDEEELALLRFTLTRLRDRLAWDNQGLDSYFHATEDNIPIRLEMFQALSQIDFNVDVTLLDKPKAQPQVRVDEPTFFKYAWFYHLKYLAPRQLKADDEILVVAAELGTKKVRKAFRAAIDDVMTQCLPYRVKRTLAFWPCSSDFALQAVDYCLWAVFRKYEMGDDQYYKMISPKIGTEFDLWARGTTTHY